MLLSVSPLAPRMGALADDFLLALAAANRSEGTIAFYRKKLGHLLGYLGAETPVSAISTRTLRKWLLAVKGGRRRSPTGQPAPVADATVEHHRKAARRLFGWAAAQRPPLVPFDPAAPLEAWIVERRELTAPSAMQVESLAAAIGSPEPFVRDRDRAIVALLIGAGVRVGELVRIALADVDRDRGIRIQGKARRDRRIPLTPRLRALLGTYVDAHRARLVESGMLFPGGRGRTTMTTNAVRKRLRAAALRASARTLGEASAGVSDDPTGPSLSPHALRHFFGTEFLRSGGDRKAAKTILGHSSDAMLDRYVHFLDADVMAQAAAHSPLERGVGVVALRGG